MIVTIAIAASTTAGGRTSGEMPTAHRATSSTRNHASFAATAAANAEDAVPRQDVLRSLADVEDPLHDPCGWHLSDERPQVAREPVEPVAEPPARDAERTIAMSTSAATMKIAVPMTASQITLGLVVCPVTITPITAIKGRTRADRGSKNAENTMPAVAVSAGISHCR